MPRPNGTMYPWERAELHQANVRYHNAVNRVKMHPNSARIYEADEKKSLRRFDADHSQICWLQIT